MSEDNREVWAYIAEQTEQPLAAAQKYHEARTRYTELNRAMYGGHFETDAERTAEREKHSDLFHKQEGSIPVEDQSDVLRYVVRTTDLDDATVAQMIAEEIGYGVAKGILQPNVYTYCKAWADKIAAEARAPVD